MTHQQFPPAAGNFCLQPKSQQEAPIPGHGIGNWMRWVLGKGKALKKTGQSSAGALTKSQSYLLKLMLGEA